MQYNYRIILTTFFSSMAYAADSMGVYCYNNQHQYYVNKTTHFQRYKSTDKSLSIDQKKITHHSNIGQKKLCHSQDKGVNSQNDQAKINKSNEKFVSGVDCPVPANYFQNEQGSISNLSENKEQALLQAMQPENKPKDKLHPSRFYAVQKEEPYKAFILLLPKAEELLHNLITNPNTEEIMEERYLCVIKILRRICKLANHKIVNEKWYVKAQIQEKLVCIICEKDDKKEQLNYAGLVEINDDLGKKLSDLEPFHVCENGTVEEFDHNIPIYFSCNEKKFCTKITKKYITGNYYIEFIKLIDEKEVVLKTAYIEESDILIGRFFYHKTQQFSFVMYSRGVKINKPDHQCDFLVLRKQKVTRIIGKNRIRFDAYITVESFRSSDVTGNHFYSMTFFSELDKSSKQGKQYFDRIDSPSNQLGTQPYAHDSTLSLQNMNIGSNRSYSHHSQPAIIKPSNKLVWLANTSISIPINGTTYYYDSRPTSIYYHRSNSQMALDQINHMKRLLSSHNITVSPACQNLNVFNADAPILPKIPTEYALTSASSSPSLIIRSENDREKNKEEEVLLALPLLDPSNIEDDQELDNDSVSLVSIPLSDKNIPDPLYA